MRTVGFYTLGCKVNQYETEAMIEMFTKNGYQVQDFSSPCDIYIINTCTVTNQSDSKSRKMIHKAHRTNRDAIICVVGCYSQVSPQEVLEIEGVDLIVGTQNRHHIVDIIEKYSEGDSKTDYVDSFDAHQSFEKMTIKNQTEMTRSYIKIQEGCQMYCSYCIIPYARGPVRSRDKEDIYHEACTLAENGFREIVLTGIHVASYGKDLREGSLIEVIEQLSAIDGIDRLRLSSLEPGLIDEEFLLRLKETRKACDHFHLSLQSGADSVLKSMNRKYTSSFFEERVAMIRKVFPDAGLTTDIIVGFPGETEEEFEQTCRFCEKIHFSKIHVFPYSPRKGTKAAKMADQISDEIKKKRAQHLITLQGRLQKQFLEAHIDTYADVLCEDKNDRGMNSGYTTNYMRVKIPYDKRWNNQIISVRLKERKEDYLIGEAVREV